MTNETKRTKKNVGVREIKQPAPAPPLQRKNKPTHLGDLDPLAASPRPLPEPAPAGDDDGSSFTGEFLRTRVKWPWRAPERGVFRPGVEEAFDRELAVVDETAAVVLLLPLLPPSSEAPFPEPMLMRLTLLSPPALLRRRRRLGVARAQLPGAVAPPPPPPP